MQGTRVYGKGPHELKPGEYVKHEDGNFYAIPPDTKPDQWLCANLEKHKIEEHEDGTITVSPSIRVGGHDEIGTRVEWHGYLEKGIWRQCS